jgi:large subunit ribosomal protein L3
MLGLLGKKLGMTQVFDESGVLTPVTVIEIVENTILNQRTEETDGYSAAVVGAFDQKESRLSKPVLGQFKKSGSAPKRIIHEVRDADFEGAPGDSLNISQFEGVRFVDVIGDSKGKGYQGVMKRHGFKGGRATHGSKFHRGLGSTGMAAWPSKVHKGSKMPGRMGGERVTVQNLLVVKIDPEKNALLVKGAVPGPKNGVVFVRKAKKR